MSAASQSLSVGEQDGGSTVRLRAGKALQVRLRSARSGGYDDWVLATAPDPVVLKPTGAEHEPPTVVMPGASGNDVFRFEALAKGRTRLVATATRPWKGGETETFTLDVVVE